MLQDTPVFDQICAKFPELEKDYQAARNAPYPVFEQFMHNSFECPPEEMETILSSHPGAPGKSREHCAVQSTESREVAEAYNNLSHALKNAVRRLLRLPEI